jgi:hypothetical protein
MSDIDPFGELTAEPSTRSITSSTVTSTSDSSSNISFGKLIKYALLIIIIIFVSYIIYAYLVFGTPYFEELYKSFISYFNNQKADAINSNITPFSGAEQINKIPGELVKLDNNIQSVSNSVVDNIANAVTLNQANELDMSLVNPNSTNRGNTAPEANLADTSTQPLGKSGWCYIGEETETGRKCIQVGPNDQCMSGDIFPTNDICVNPTLRR